MDNIEDGLSSDHLQIKTQCFSFEIKLFTALILLSIRGAEKSKVIITLNLFSRVAVGGWSARLQSHFESGLHDRK